jgi:hypothetical protein
VAELRAGERHVGEPPGGGHLADEGRGQHEAAGAEEDPVAERVEPGERHVPGAQHERQQVVAEPGEHGRVEQEDHDRPVHREQLVVRLGADEVLVGPGQLRPHPERHQAGEGEQQERRDDVAHADALVVDGGEEPDQAGRVLPGLLQLVLDRGALRFDDGLALLDRGHGAALSGSRLSR